MPQGCGTWPAAWETDGSNWPNGGEVDIVSLRMLLPLKGIYNGSMLRLLAVIALLPF